MEGSRVCVEEEVEAHPARVNDGPEGCCGYVGRVKPVVITAQDTSVGKLKKGAVGGRETGGDVVGP